MIISTIGSCRVAGPMTKLQAQRNFVLDNRLLYGFTHNTKETIQAIRYMRGEVSLSESIWPFVSSEPVRESNPVSTEAADSLHVVEISSTKVLELDGMYLQLVRFKEALKSSPELLKIFFSHASHESLAKRQAALQEAASFAHVTEQVQHALTHTVMYVQNAQEILDDLKTIQQLLGSTFVLVTHCNAMNVEGHPIANRAQMVETIRLAASTLGIPVIEPGALLAHFGQSRGMPEEGRDTTHYTPAFAKLVGHAICEKLLGTADQNTAEPAEPLDWKQCIERAKASARKFEWDNALLLTNRAIELKNSPTAHVLRARAVTALNQTDDILDAWSIALATDSNRSAYILRQAAEAALTVGDYDKARDWGIESMGKEANEKTALLLGRIHSRQGQNAQAEQAFRSYAVRDSERALRFASRAHTPLADAANMVNALASTPGIEQAQLDAARAAVLKRATREVKRTGRVGTLLPTVSAFYALQSLPHDTTQEGNQADQINQAYRRLLKAYESYPEYQNNSETVTLLSRLAPLAPVNPRYVQRAAKQLQAQGHTRAAIECWRRIANAPLPAERDAVILAATKLSQLGAYQAAAHVYLQLLQSGAMDLNTAHEYIDKCLRALARSFRKCLAEERLRDAEDALKGIQAIDPSYQGLTSLQRSLAAAHKREFLTSRSNAASADEVVASARRVIETSPTDREANIELAMHSLKNGNVAESRRILDRFLQSSPI